MSGGVEADHLERLILEHVTAPFDLAQGPLARFSVFKVAESEHVLLIVFHHVVLDGWSCGTLLRELGEIYQAKRQGRSLRLGQPVQYAEFVKWSLSESQTDKAKIDNEYWQNLYADEFREIELPADHLRPAEKTYVAGHLRDRLDESLTRGFERSQQVARMYAIRFSVCKFQRVAATSN